MILLAALGSGCSGSEAAPVGDVDCAGLSIVATTTVLGDVASHVGGEVEVLVPRGADPHSFQPSARQIARLRSADLVVANGLGLEEGLVDVLESAVAEDVDVFFAADHVELLPYAGEEGEGAGHDQKDPHIWTDPTRMADVAVALGEAVGAVDPGCADTAAAAAESYREELLGLDAEIEAIVAPIPGSDRKLITNHSALGYWADRYGFDVVGVVIPGGSTLAEPSPADLARLVSLIEREGVRAIFAETTQPADLAGAIAGELGRPVAVVPLYTGSLGDVGSGAETYVGMMRVNAQLISEALLR